MEKKYFSDKEFSIVNPLRKEDVKPYTGYVLVRDGKAYAYNTGEELIVNDNYISTVNLSEEYFDRILDEPLSLPRSLEDCTFEANDFLKASVIHNIIKSLEENNSYIFKNCILPKNDLPLADKIPVLSPYFSYSLSGNTYNLDNPQEVEGWYWSNITYNYIYDINTSLATIDSGADAEKLAWKDLDTSTLTDAVCVWTDKTASETDATNLYAVFLAFQNKVKLINLYPYDIDKLQYTDPFKESQNKDFIDNSINERKFIHQSPVNNPEPGREYDNLNLRTIKNIDPNDDKSFEFKNISGISVDGPYLYIVDKTLNGVFQYDISRCLTDRGVVTNDIKLIDYIQGKGGLNDAQLFNGPTSIAAFNGLIAVLDKGNNVIKAYDRYFNHKFTLKHGAFNRQNAQSISICPYEFKLNGKIIEKGSIFVLCSAGNTITIDIFDKNGSYIGNNAFDNISLFDEKWVNPVTGDYSSKQNPIHCSERLKKVEFSKNNSNFYYIITDRRVIKCQLSKFTKPIGVLNYSYTSTKGSDGLVWETTYQPWDAVRDFFNNLAVWESTSTKSTIEYPVNKCFCIAESPYDDNDIFLNILDNKLLYDDGEIQRWDNDTDQNLLYVDNKTRKFTYEAFDSSDQVNRPAYVKTGIQIDEYEPDNVTGEPVKTNRLFTIIGKNSKLDSINNAILFYKEPNIFKSILLDTELHLFTKEEMSFLGNDEYFNQITFNKILYKLYFNLCQIKKYIFGTFSGGYSSDNILTYDHIETDSSIRTLGENKEDFFVGENEQASIMLNRCFINLYNVQLNILKKIQTKFISTIEYNKNTYKII